VCERIIHYKNTDGGHFQVKMNSKRKDKWIVRAFGWGFKFFSVRGFKPTVTQPAANEAAESAALINSEFIEFKPPVPQPVAISKPAVTEPNLAR